MEENTNQQGPQEQPQQPAPAPEPKEDPKEEPKSEPKEEPKTEQKDIKSALAQFEAFLDEYMVKKAPFAIPAGGKEFIVKIAPYLVIIGAILLLPAIFAAIGLSAFVAPFAMMGAYGYGHVWGFRVIISLIVSVIALILEIIAVPGLFKLTRNGWNMVFYASIVSFVGSILSLNIIGGIIGAIIGWYILFQVKDMYKN